MGKPSSQWKKTRSSAYGASPPPNRWRRFGLITTTNSLIWRVSPNGKRIAAGGYNSDPRFGIIQLLETDGASLTPWRAGRMTKIQDRNDNSFLAAVMWLRNELSLDQLNSYIDRFALE